MEKLFPTFLKLGRIIYLYFFNEFRDFVICVFFYVGEEQSSEENLCSVSLSSTISCNKEQYQILLLFVFFCYCELFYFFVFFLLSPLFCVFGSEKEREKKKQHEKLYRYPCHYHSYIHVYIYFFLCIVCYIICKEIFILLFYSFSIFVLLIKRVPFAVAVNKRKSTTTKRLTLFSDFVLK